LTWVGEKIKNKNKKVAPVSRLAWVGKKKPSLFNPKP